MCNMQSTPKPLLHLLYARGKFVSTTQSGHVKHVGHRLGTCCFFTKLRCPQDCTLLHTYIHIHTYTHTCFLGVSCCVLICVVCAKESAAISASVHLAHVSCTRCEIMLTKYMPHKATDLLCSGCLLITMKSTPGGIGLTGQRRPQNPGAVQEHNPRGQQTGCLQPPRGH